MQAVMHTPRHFSPLSPHAAAPEPSRGQQRRFCDGLLPHLCGIQSNPEQPEPPMNAAALQRLWGARGSGGGCTLWHSPPAALRCTACVSLRLPQASLGDCKQSLSLVMLRMTFFRPVKAFGFLRLRSAIASNRCRSSHKARPEPKAPSVIRFADATSLPEGGLFTPCGCTTAS